MRQPCPFQNVLKSIGNLSGGTDFASVHWTKSSKKDRKLHFRIRYLIASFPYLHPMKYTDPSSSITFSV